MEDGESDRDFTVKEFRKLRESGNSVVVSMPPNILQEAQMQLGDRVQLVASREEGTVTITLAEDSD